MVYAPAKYFTGLNPEQKKKRMKRIIEGSKSRSDDPKAYRPFETDKGAKVKTSKYTTAFKKLFPNANSLNAKSDVTGVPLDIIQEVYDKGLAAWRTGHRPGASQQAWGYARVHSFLMKGCTFYSADKYLVNKAIKIMKKNDVSEWTKRNSLCPKYK
jgi:hypothetical protein